MPYNPMKLAALVFSLALTPGASAAIAGEGQSPSFFNGTELHARLGDFARNPSKDVISASVAYGFVLGVADAIHGYKEPRTGFCYRRPDKVTTAQLVERVYAYLEKRPESRPLSAWSLTAAALAEAYPCK